MNLNLKLAAVFAGAAVTLFAGALATVPMTQATPGVGTESILGSWNADVTTVGQGLRFPALVTFTYDGAIIGDEPPLAGETTAHGNWTRGRHGGVDFTFVALFSEPATATYAGRLKVVGTLQRTHGQDIWSGPFEITVYDASDHTTLSDTGTFALTRLAVESLD